MSRRDWQVQIVVHASKDELDEITERIGSVICVPPDHAGRCSTPWFMSSCAVDDLDEPKRSATRALLDDER